MDENTYLGWGALAVLLMAFDSFAMSFFFFFFFFDWDHEETLMASLLKDCNTTRICGNV